MTGSASAVALDAAGVDLIARTWGWLSRPGSFFSGADRVAVAREARAARGHEPPGPRLGGPASDAIRRIAADPASIRPEMIEVWSLAGLDRLSYVELVSVVAQSAAIDSHVMALGLLLEPLPEPEAGDPDGFIDESAEITNGWVPTVGPAGAPTALSALPREAEALHNLHGALYIGGERFFDLDGDPDRPLTRPQMELVAARTSWLNECFY